MYYTVQNTRQRHTYTEDVPGDYTPGKKEPSQVEVRRNDGRNSFQLEKLLVQKTIYIRQI